MAPIDEENFCYYPFSQLLLQPNGTISPCCWSQNVAVGQAPQDSLAGAWNGERMRALRREFLAGKPVTCKREMSHIGCHRFSRRPYRAELSLTEVQERPPARLDLRLNGQCNLECVMCDVWKQPNGLYDRTRFWADGPTELFPHLKELSVLGGEPFIQKDTYRLIDEVSACNPACTWAFVTNGSYTFNRAIRERLDKISIRWIQLSLDSLNAETYSRIRKGGTFAKTLETLEALHGYQRERQQAGRAFRLYISMCVQKLNWREMPGLAKFALERELPLIFQFAYRPAAESLLGLSETERREIMWFIRDEVHPICGPEAAKPVWAPLRDSLRAPGSARAESPIISFAE
ncbi:MAG TPA: radical SAM protein [Bdellovibrionales bacterium]|nr:radical SAM protein [Bdellovibrionales bacterium]